MFAAIGPPGFPKIRGAALEEASMVPLIGFHLKQRVAFSAFLLSISLLLAQEQQKTNFYDVGLSNDEVYKYSNLKYSGDYTSFESLSGHIALGKTEGGVTVVIIVGEGTVKIEAPEANQDKV